MAIQQQGQALDTQIRLKQNEMIKDTAKDAWNIYMRSVELHQQVQALDTQIRLEQNEMIKDTAKAVWNVYMRSVELHQQTQLQNATALIDGIAYVTRDFHSALEFATATASMYSISSGITMIVLSTNPIGAIFSVVIGLASVYLYIRDIILED